MALLKITTPDGTVLRKANNPEDVYFGESDTVAASCVAYWPLNDNAADTAVVDCGPNALDGVSANNTDTMSVSGKVDEAFDLNGSTDLFTVTYNAALNPGLGSYTWSFWFNADTVAAGDHFLLYKNDGGTAPYNGFYAKLAASTFTFGITDGYVASEISVSKTGIQAGKWYEVTVVRNRSTGYLMLYFDSVYETQTADTTNDICGTDNLTIGAKPGAVDPFDGKIDDVRFYNAALPQKAIDLIYNAYEIDSCVGHWPLNDNTDDTEVEDTSGYDNDGTLEGGDNTEDVSASGTVWLSLQFNGIDQYVDCGDVNEAEGLATITLCSWNYPTAHTGTILSKNGPYSLEFTADSKYRFCIYADSAWTCVITDAAYDLDAWYHVAGTYDGTTLRIYVNGSLVKSGAHSAGGVIGSTAGILYIGFGGSVFSNYFTGKIDDVRIYDKALSLSEIGEIYNSGIGTPLHPKSSIGNGTTYHPVLFDKCSFEIDPVRITGQESIPTTSITIEHVSRFLKPYLDTLDLADDTTVELIVANRAFLTGDAVEVSMFFDLLDGEIDTKTARFTLGAPAMLTRMLNSWVYEPFHCNADHFEATECAYTRKTVADVTLPSGTPVSIEVTAHGYITGDSIRLEGLDDLTPDLSGTYTITKTDANNFTLDDTDGDDYTGSYSSGGTAGHATCSMILSECRLRGNSANFCNCPCLRQGTATIA